MSPGGGGARASVMLHPPPHQPARPRPRAGASAPAQRRAPSLPPPYARGTGHAPSGRPPPRGRGRGGCAPIGRGRARAGPAGGGRGKLRHVPGAFLEASLWRRGPGSRGAAPAPPPAWRVSSSVCPSVLARPRQDGRRGLGHRDRRLGTALRARRREAGRARAGRWHSGPCLNSLGPCRESCGRAPGGKGRSGSA